jgi:hypothetical protein
MNETINSGAKADQAKAMGKDALQRGHKLLHEGNSRHLVITYSGGKKLAEINLTAAVALGLVVLALAWWILPLVVALGYLWQLRVSVIRELAKDDNVIEINEES